MGKMAKKTFLIEKIMLYYWGREVRKMSYEDIFNLLKQFGITTHKDLHIISFYDDDANDYMSGDIPINEFTEAKRIGLRSSNKAIAMDIKKKYSKNNVDVFVPHILYIEEDDFQEVKAKTSYSVRVVEPLEGNPSMGVRLKLHLDYSINNATVIQELLEIDLASGSISSAEYALKDDGNSYPINGVFSPEFGSWGSMTTEHQIKVLEHPAFKNMIDEYYAKRYPKLLETIDNLKAYQNSFQDINEDDSKEDAVISFRELVERYIKTHPKIEKAVDGIRLVLKKKDDKE